MSFAKTEMAVIQWAEDRKIIFNSTPEAQLLSHFLVPKDWV